MKYKVIAFRDDDNIFNITSFSKSQIMNDGLYVASGVLALLSPILGSLLEEKVAQYLPVLMKTLLLWLKN